MLFNAPFYFPKAKPNASTKVDISPPNFSPKQPPKPHSFFKNLLMSVFILTLLVVAAYKGADFLEVTETGEVVLTKERREKLDKDMEKYDHAVQYVLVALLEGDFPCFSCPNGGTIKLYPGEVYKYGVTINGEVGRYGTGLAEQKLTYIPQVKGSIDICLKEERRKIYNYALLPENLNRTPPLIRPPGNKKDF